jgi:hypothetical protein
MTTIAEEILEKGMIQSKNKWKNIVNLNPCTRMDPKQTKKLNAALSLELKITLMKTQPLNLLKMECDTLGRMGKETHTFWLRLKAISETS